MAHVQRVTFLVGIHAGLWDYVIHKCIISNPQNCECELFQLEFCSFDHFISKASRFQSCPTKPPRKRTHSMSWIGRAISSVGQYYKEINPATLSGAIDVIVVESRRQSTKDEQDDPSTPDLSELACSPWHVRFGKLSVLRPVDRKVRILINGEPAPFNFSLGLTRTESTDTPVASAQDSTTRQELETVPDFADLGEPQLESCQVKRHPSRETAQPSSSNDNQLNSSTVESSAVEIPEEEGDIPSQRQLSNQPAVTSDGNPKKSKFNIRFIGTSNRWARRFVPHTVMSLPTADLMLDMDGYKMTHEAPHGSESDPNLDSSPQDDEINELTEGSDSKRRLTEDPTIDLQESLVMEFTTAS
ncbi:hypothetical protein KEM48_006753 [Puccinia striiformis f. sp. tritici PST-130]|nr:hypothetical protein KEM48_006753 [Puccinia striiformis f. sp. tritici PST-130]